MSRPLQIGFAGLAHSHPYSDAENALAVGAEIVGVADPDPRRRAEFAHRFGCPQRDSLAALCARRPDLIIATPHLDDVPRTAALLAASGAPVFFNKVIAANRRQLEAWDEAVDGVPSSLIGTSSVLRFAPAVQELRRATADAEILGIRVIAQHDNALFRSAGREWQDDPTVGGGTLVTVGVHAWEMVDVLLPGAVLTGSTGWVRRRAGSPTRSEDAAAVSGTLSLPGGGAVPVEAWVTGVPGPDRYAIEALTADGVAAADIGRDADADEAMGFAGLIRELAAAAREGRLPVDGAQSRTVVANTIRAAEIARGTGAS
ncbi:hypothetical protein BOH66_03035 [Microbacterium aurum]|uniref:Oxidoreductase n=1 Tax=Microbacterium aurum TaxID=36805 RepID=A0A1P8U5I5_9MICO|nr:hypothetical protein [Microbacterium aurum]APZ33365.1 hypothetical protein BOH66_03035 [Microbacterium aurum]MBM7827014.1 putative dehydrogenase [Microbacterium aurum]